MASGASSDIVVEATGLTKVFTDFWFRQKAVAVDGVSFEIRRDEIFACSAPTAAARAPPSR